MAKTLRGDSVFRSDRSPLLLAGLLATAGMAHFIAPRQFDAIVPRALPGSPRAWTYASGAAELALAAGVALPRTRRRAAVTTAAYFVGVFPANVQMAVDWRHRPTAMRAAAFGRLPLQVPLVLWARGVARGGAAPRMRQPIPGTLARPAVGFPKGPLPPPEES